MPCTIRVHLPVMKCAACIGDEAGSQAVPEPARASGMPSTPAMGIGMGISCPGCWATRTSSNDNIRSARLERQGRPLRFVVGPRNPRSIGALHVDELHVPAARRVECHLSHAGRIGACATLGGCAPPTPQHDLI